MNTYDRPCVPCEIEHVSYHWPDGVHAREELRILEPGRRDYDAPPPGPCTHTVAKVGLGLDLKPDGKP